MPRSADAHLTADRRSYATHPPKAIGGSLALDFINTITWRGDAARQAERLSAYPELVHWSQGIGLIDARCAVRLLAAAKARPRAATVVCNLALRLRGELENAFDAARKGSADLAAANGLLRDMAKIGRLVHRNGGGRHLWQPAGAAPDLRLPLLPVAISALALAVSGRRQHLKSCADPHCGWMFLDETRNQSRQWCSMEGCGNRAKARAHYARRKAAG